jgi:hypothetical protein
VEVEVEDILAVEVEDITVWDIREPVAVAAAVILFPELSELQLRQVLEAPPVIIPILTI